MKKNYLFLLTFLTFTFGFSQSVITTIDSPNSVGPTDSGNSAEISSTGLTRGAGINLATANLYFTSRPWNATSQSEARVEHVSSVSSYLLRGQA